MFPQSGTAAVPAAAPPAEPVKAGNRTLLLAVGGVVAALVVGGGAFFLLTSGGGDEPAALPAKGTPVAAASPSATPSPSASVKPKATIKTVTVAARDPFAVLFPPKPTVAPPAAPSTTSTTPPSPTAPVPVAASVTLSVASVNLANQTATVTVDGTKYAATVGKVFAKTFVLYSVFNSSCVGLLYGDQNVAVCTSKPVSVTA
jgi:hypothetical protein